MDTINLTQQHAALRFITCGSVDDGKSTLIGRLLVDSKSVLQDHLAGVQRHGATDLALLTDGLSAEREQGITIDVAYRYFSTEQRKFIIGDAPGHEQYTRNMVTAASSADAAVVLIDATKLEWQKKNLQLLPQTRRHTLLLQLLRVQSIIFAINKLDAVVDSTLAYENIKLALEDFMTRANIHTSTCIPISALVGFNVVTAQDGWCGYHGPSLLELLEKLPATTGESNLDFSFPVQWVEKYHDSSVITKGRRIYWGRVSTGIAKVGQTVRIFPGDQSAQIVQVLNHTREESDVHAGLSAGLILDREVDVSRGDWILSPTAPVQENKELKVTMAWLDDTPLVSGRVYLALHGHRSVKVKIQQIIHRLDIHDLSKMPASELPSNTIGDVLLQLQQSLVTAPFANSRSLGAMVLIDPVKHTTSAAVMVQA